MKDYHAKIGEGGRLVIPAAYRKILDLHPGDELIIRLEKGEIRLFRQTQAIQQIRAAAKKYSKQKVNQTRNFLAFRKKDSE